MVVRRQPYRKVDGTDLGGRDRQDARALVRGVLAERPVWVVEGWILTATATSSAKRKPPSA